MWHLLLFVAFCYSLIHIQDSLIFCTTVTLGRERVWEVDMTWHPTCLFGKERRVVVREGFYHADVCVH